MNLPHAISHWLGINGGNSNTGWIGNALVTCFICATCGKREGCHYRTPPGAHYRDVPKTSPIYRIKGPLSGEKA